MRREGEGGLGERRIFSFVSVARPSVRQSDLCHIAANHDRGRPYAYVAYVVLFGADLGCGCGIKSSSCLEELSGGREMPRMFGEAQFRAASEQSVGSRVSASPPNLHGTSPGPSVRPSVNLFLSFSPPSI